MEEEGSTSSSKRVVELLEELLVTLRGNDGKLPEGKVAQQSEVNEWQDKQFGWYEHTYGGLNFLSISIDSIRGVFFCTDLCS
jgi:hypothetical protein